MNSKKRNGEAIKMGQVKLSMIIDFYVGDMERRGCTPDSVITNRRSLIRFNRFLSSNTESATLAELTPAISKDLCWLLIQSAKFFGRRSCVASVGDSLSNEPAG
jgi:hypothetical protein